MPFFVKRNGQAVPIVSEPNVINDTTASQNTAYSGNKVDSLIANKIDALTPKIYSLFIAKTDWDETGTVEIDVPGTFGYDIPSENYNQLVLSDEQTDHWRRFNVCLDHAHDASGYITTIEFSCDPGNIPDRPIYFNIVSSKSEYVDWSVIGNLIVPPGLQVDTSFDNDSTNPVQNKVIKSALDGKATIDDTTASQNTVYSGSKVDNLIANHTHASNQINAMTGYSKPSSTSNITPADSLNTAIGKVEKGLEGKQSPLSLGQYSGLGREIQVMDNEEVGQTWYNTGVVDIEPSSSEGKLTVSKVDDSTFPGSAPYTSEDIDIPGWEKVENSPITTTSTGSDLTLSTSEGNINALTVYGKSEVVDGSIKSAGEGWSTVDLGTLDWKYNSSTLCFVANMPNDSISPVATGTDGFCAKYTKSSNDDYPDNKQFTINNLWISSSKKILIKDTDYTDPTAFKAAMSGVLLCYQLADPSQGNAIAIKTDNGSGVDGTMAVFETGTPLYGVSDTVRDVMTWDGSAGTVTKICGEVDLGTLNWAYRENGQYFTVSIPNCIYAPTRASGKKPMISGVLLSVTPQYLNDLQDKQICYALDGAGLYAKNYDYTDAAAFKTAMSGVMLVYELAAHTTETLTTAENASIAGLRTFEPQTHAQNNAQTEMTIEAYAGTANGQAVQELKQDVQSEITALKITQSDTLTLTTSGWSNNTQTVTYAHDTAKRNVIDVDPSSIEEWASCGILATAETATSITFTCKAVPEKALTFRVTSMGVN